MASSAQSPRIPADGATAAFPVLPALPGLPGLPGEPAARGGSRYTAHPAGAGSAARQTRQQTITRMLQAGPRGLATVTDESVLAWLATLDIPEEYDQPAMLLLVQQARGSAADAAAGPAAAREARNAARTQLLFAHYRLIYRVARTFDGRGVELWDLMQEGSLGFLRAVEKYDPARGAHLSTYAVWWILQAVSRCVHEQRSVIDLPEHMAEKADKLFQLAQAGLLSDEEIAATLDLPLGTIAAVRNARGVVSLEEPRTPEGGFASSGRGHNPGDQVTLGDLIADERTNVEEQVVSALTTAELQAVLQSKLNPREYTVLARHYGLPPYGQVQTYVEVGRALGVSRERVRQLEACAFAKLRLALKRPSEWRTALRALTDDDDTGSPADDDGRRA
jgi:RNA polymerase primary sigma factor